MRKITGIDIGIIFSVLGILAGGVIVFLEARGGRDRTLGIILLCCSAWVFSLCVKRKKGNK